MFNTLQRSYEKTNTFNLILISTNLKANEDSFEISAHIVGKKCISHETPEFLFAFENPNKYIFLMKQNVNELKIKLLSENIYDEVSVSYDTILEKLDKIETQLLETSKDFQNKFSKKIGQEKLKNFTLSYYELQNLFFVDRKESIYSNLMIIFFMVQLLNYVNSTIYQISIVVLN